MCWHYLAVRSYSAFNYIYIKELCLFNFTSIRKTLFFLAAAMSSFTCLEFIAKGFSQSTFFPASRNSRPTRQCSVCSTPTYTMSVRVQVLHNQLQKAT